MIETPYKLIKALLYNTHNLCLLLLKDLVIQMDLKKCFYGNEDSINLVCASHDKCE